MTKINKEPYRFGNMVMEGYDTISVRLNVTWWQGEAVNSLSTDIIRGYSYRISSDKETVKECLVRILALSEMVNEFSCYCILSLDVKSHLAEYEKRVYWNRSLSLMNVSMSPYAFEFDNPLKMVAVMDDDYLNGLPLGIGDIIREIEAEREVLIKKKLFELKLSGNVLTSRDDLLEYKNINFLKEGIGEIQF